MRCKACWREAERMARRGGAPDNAMRRVTKRIYLSHHIAAQPLGLSDPTCTHLIGESVLGQGSKHIRPGGYRRHKNGKVIPAMKNGS